MNIELTNLAKEKILEIANETGTENYFLRIKILGGGCASFSFDLSLDQVKQDQDESFMSNDIPIIIDQITFHYLSDLKIDYIEGIYESGFKFESKDIKYTCGCSKSFSF